MGAPPLFFTVSADDQTVGHQGSIDLFAPWREAGQPAEVPVFPRPGSAASERRATARIIYLDRLREWLKVNGWFTMVPN